MIIDTSEEYGNVWNEKKLLQIWGEIERIAEGYGLDYHPCDLVRVGPHEMIDAMSKHGLAEFPTHWSQGKDALIQENNWKKGGGLPYELVINTNPIHMYVMDTNSMSMQALVLAHAGPGHGSFFTNNYLFKDNTDATFIRPYLRWARRFIEQCESKYGEDEVEAVQDACMAFERQSVFRGRKSDFNIKKEIARQREKKRRHETLFEDYEHVNLEDGMEFNILPEPQENLLYFFEKHSSIAPWKKEICRIYRMVAQYFYPQILTKTMNEGWASFWHYKIMMDLYKQDHIDIGCIQQMLNSHDGVLCHCHSIEKQGIDFSFQTGTNPYASGFKIFEALERVCSNPTDEDKKQFPDIAGSDWLSTLKHIAYNFKDTDFYAQWMPNSVIRDMKFFIMNICDDGDAMYHYVKAAHTDKDYDELKLRLADTLEYDNIFPNIVIEEYNPSENTIKMRCEGELKTDMAAAAALDNYIKTLWLGEFE